MVKTPGVIFLSKRRGSEKTPGVIFFWERLGK